MAQITIDLAKDILNGAGVTKNEIDQLCNFYLANLPRIAQQEPVKLPPEWKQSINLMWQCVRKHDCSIPDYDLDLMRNMLLSFIPPAPEGDKPCA